MIVKHQISKNKTQRYKKDIPGNFLITGVFFYNNLCFCTSFCIPSYFSFTYITATNQWSDEVYWEICQDLPKTTKLMIDGKTLYIHRANFQIIDKALLN